MKSDEHYICQRAANAIISEIGPFRVSTDALQAINQFLDEFIVLLLTCSLSLDLSQIKSVVVSLLPSTLGKNAIVEAELEVKTFTETESIDYDLYERMRNLAEKDFPLNEAVPLLREKCFEFCTLADKDDQLYLQKSIRHKRNEANMKVIISPIVAIYVTTVMEHIAEYLLTAVAMTAEHEDTDYVRVKEVFLALIDDIQLGDVFHRMDLKDKMEKRAGFLNANVARASYLPNPPAPANNRKSYTMDHQSECARVLTKQKLMKLNYYCYTDETGSFLDITFDDLDLDYFDDNPRKSTVSTTSRAPEMARPHSAMSYSSTTTANTNALHTTHNANRKSTFHLFKNNRNSFSGDVLPRASSPASSVYDPDAPNAMNFDDLIKSGGTVKVSLTPNRLRSIEHKDELAPPQPTWERRSTSSASPRLSAVHSLPSRPSSPLVHQPPSIASSNSSISSKLPVLASPPTPKPAAITPLGKLPPTPTTAPSPSKRSPSVRSANVSASTPSVNNSSNDSIASTVSSVASMPSPIVKSTSHPTTISIQEPPLPRPSKSNSNNINTSNTNIINTNGMVIRRSSMSNRKSRENLRKLKEEQLQKELAAVVVDEPLPTAVVKSSSDGAAQAVDAATLSPERPSSMVAKRASMISSNRRRSMHEDVMLRQRVSTVGSVSVSIKQWDDILKSEETTTSANVIPPAAHRRSVLRQLRQQQQQQAGEQNPDGSTPSSSNNNNAVLDKVLKFERASTLDDHQRVSHMPRRERFLYLQQDPSAIERKSTILSPKKPIIQHTPHRAIGIDQGVQTDFVKQQDTAKKHGIASSDDDEEEHGEVDGDEEWFLQDSEWDEQEEVAMVEWLLGD
ncbi:hypothetical protein FB192DRAFT_1471282, partial [Mucor lusitanicus]